jgi:hypothetical protein
MKLKKIPNEKINQSQKKKKRTMSIKFEMRKNEGVKLKKEKNLKNYLK